MNRIRLSFTIDNVRFFVRENKKTVLGCALVFLAGIIFGICITVIGCEGQFARVNTNDVIFGAFRMFFRFSLIELGGYVIIMISTANFFLTLCSVGVIIVNGYVFGKFACVLVGCYSICGTLNLIFIYIPVFVICFVCMLVAIIRISLRGDSCGVLQSRSYCSCHAVRTSKVAALKPNVKTVIIIFGVNVSLNFVVFIILGLLFPVIVV